MLAPAVLAWLDVPIAGAGVASGALVVGIIVLYRIITDRSAVKSEIDTLTRQIGEQSRQMNDLRQHVDRLEVMYDEQRRLKHSAFNDVTRALTALELVRQLARECTCGVLTPLTEIIERILDEMETTRRPTRTPDPQ